MDGINKNKNYSGIDNSFISKSEEKRIKVSKIEKDNKIPRSKEEGTIISIINENAPVSMKKISQKARISMSKCAILISGLIKNKVIDKKDVTDAPK